MIFSKNSPTRAHSTLLRPARTPSPCAHVHVVCWCFPHRLSPACASSRIISDFRADIRNIPLPPTFVSPTRYGGDVVATAPFLLGLVRSRGRDPFSILDSRPYLGCCRYQRPLALAPRLPCRLALGLRPSFPPVSLLLLLLSEVSSLHTHSRCFLFVPALVSRRRQVSVLRTVYAVVSCALARRLSRSTFGWSSGSR